MKLNKSRDSGWIYRFVYWSVAFFMTGLFMYLVFGQTPMDYRSESYANSGDQRLNMLFHQWNIDWVFGEVPAATLGYWNFYIYYPYQKALALSSNHLGSLPIHLVLNVFEEDWLARGNLWLYACFVLNALSAFVCVRWVLGVCGPRLKNFDEILIGCLIALSFAFSLNRINYIDHAQTLPSFALPFFFYFGWIALRTGAWTSAVLAALFFVWQVYLDLHIAIFCMVVSTLLIPLVVVIHLESPKSWWIRALRQMVVFCSIALALSLPLLIPYLETVSIFGAREFVKGPSLKHYFFPTHYSKMLYEWFPQRTFNDKSVLPHYVFVPLFLGLLVGMVGSIVRSVVKGRRARALVAVSLLFLLWVFVDFMVHRSSFAWLLHHLVPGASSLRTPARLSILLGPLFFGVFCWFLYTRTNYVMLRRIVLLLILATMVAEARSIRLLVWERKEVAELEAAFKVLEGPAIILPITTDPYENLDYMMLAQKFRLQIANGYSGFMPDGLYDLFQVQQRFPGDVLVENLRGGFYREVVVDTRSMQVSPTLHRQAMQIGHFLVFENPKELELPVDWRLSKAYFPWLGPLLKSRIHQPARAICDYTYWESKNSPSWPPRQRL